MDDDDKLMKHGQVHQYQDDQDENYKNDPTETSQDSQDTQLTCRASNTNLTAQVMFTKTG